ncbi:hypothetical protein KDK95_10475 [Actinospica sp. MGRD01-02]|uniref:Uncharacterized protein n=1 Tax=Actinospica acidithermotolerans TaxID=2828514 RepID=A0A941EA53_9ACTN|nr:hypothetical protein [Actinospica acidithermotolerans]MBR7826728.1 hypothetical protein [Actinospica acidithermotolerans]
MSRTKPKTSATQSTVRSRAGTPRSRKNPLVSRDSRHSACVAGSFANAFHPLDGTPPAKSAACQRVFASSARSSYGRRRPGRLPASQPASKRDSCPSGANTNVTPPSAS